MSSSNSRNESEPIPAASTIASSSTTTTTTTHQRHHHRQHDDSYDDPTIDSNSSNNHHMSLDESDNGKIVKEQQQQTLLLKSSSATSSNSSGSPSHTTSNKKKSSPPPSLHLGDDNNNNNNDDDIIDVDLNDKDVSNNNVRNTKTDYLRHQSTTSLSAFEDAEEGTDEQWRKNGGGQSSINSSKTNPSRGSLYYFDAKHQQQQSLRLPDDNNNNNDEVSSSSSAVEIGKHVRVENDSFKKGAPGTVEVGPGTIEVGKARTPSHMEKLEIDQGGDNEVEIEEEFVDDDDEEEDADVQLERLLGESTTRLKQSNQDNKRKKKKKTICKCCPSSNNTYKVGNFNVIFPKLYSSYGWGIAGVHWWGPFFTLGIILLASEYFIRKAYHKVGWMSGTVCVIMTLLTSVLLFATSFANPGIVTSTTIQEQQELQQSTANTRTSQGDWRWCDFCKVYQPPDGAHCPDCNVCIQGYDHHCVWMGTCIGAKNFKNFTRFNLCWLGYLIYCLVWILGIGPHV